MPKRKKFELKSFEVEYVCDKCESGVMVPTGICLLIHPPLWRHTCDKCGHVQDLHDEYPIVVQERVATPE